MDATNNQIWTYLIGISKDLDEMAVKLRKYNTKIDDPKCEALFETSAEVILGLKHAYDDFIRQEEKAWR